jgi:hypothetical protein
LARALQISDGLGPQGDRLVALSETAFVHAMQTSVLVIAIIVAVTAVLIGLWAPGRDGKQLRVIRRLVNRVQREIDVLLGITRTFAAKRRFRRESRS